MTEQDRGGEDAIRVQKFLSQAGVASRREAEKLITAGRVKINGEVVTELGVRIQPDVDQVHVDDTPVESAETRWIVYHKPPGYLCTRSDPHGGRTVYDALPPWASGLRYVGRLDRDTSGLLLMTNDGDLGAALAHPRGRVEREYIATVKGAVRASTLRTLKQGVELEDGFARPKRVRRLSAGEKISEVALVLTEGRKREVRRLFLAVGHPAIALRRTRFGPFELGNLPSGEWRPAWPSELKEARAMAERAERRNARRRRPHSRR